MPGWVLLIIFASLAIGAGGLFVEYQKNKMKLMDKSNRNQKEVDEVRKLVNSLKTRIERI